VINVGIESYQTVAEKCKSDFPLSAARASWRMKRTKDQEFLVIMCMQACHMDPVEVMVSVKSRAMIKQVMRVVQSWAIPYILEGAQSRGLRSSGRFGWVSLGLTCLLLLCESLIPQCHIILISSI
jgi:hypothetical protein